MVFFLMVATSVAQTIGNPNEVGNPFAPYKPNGEAYSLEEFVEQVWNDPVELKAYQEMFQKLADYDGWAKHLKDGKVSPGGTVYLLQRLKPEMDEWQKGDIAIGRRRADDGSVEYFFRPSYKDRRKKIPGPEMVFKLDVTAITGNRDMKDNAYPIRTVGIAYCVNSSLDLREQEKRPEPESPFAFKPPTPTPKADEKPYVRGPWGRGYYPPDTVRERVVIYRDTVFMGGDVYYDDVAYMPPPRRREYLPPPPPPPPPQEFWLSRPPRMHLGPVPLPRAHLDPAFCPPRQIGGHKQIGGYGGNAHKVYFVY